MDYIWIFIPLGLIVLGLSIYLGMLWHRLRWQSHQQQEKLKQRTEHIRDSIYTIALATSQKQCELSECCIRIKHLLDFHPRDERFELIYQMYDEIKDFPTHEERRQQSKQETFQQDSQRFAIEEKYQGGMDKVLELLKIEFAPER